MPLEIEGLELFNVDEIGIIAGYSSSSITKKMVAGEIDYHVVGKAYLSTRKQVEKFLDEIDMPPGMIDFRLKRANGEAQKETST